MNGDKIKELKIDECIWIVFIILSALNICGDEFEMEYYTSNNWGSDRRAKKIFTFTVFISFIIYVYFMKLNYQHVKSLRMENCNTSLHEVRLFGSILIVVGVFMLLYFQINSSSSNNPSAV